MSKFCSLVTPRTVVSSPYRASVLKRSAPRLISLDYRNPSSVPRTPQVRRLSITPHSKMAQKPFSNTEVPAEKPADPYTATNKSDPELKEKVQDLVSFIESCKFGMMTTRIGSSGLLTSRCMALAAKVKHPRLRESSIFLRLTLTLLILTGGWRSRPSVSHQHRIWQNR